MDQCTNNCECLVIHNSSSNKLDEQVYWYKASEHEKFNVCTPEHGDIVKKIILKMMEKIMKKHQILEYIRSKKKDLN